jgi:hypothetical protein
LTHEHHFNNYYNLFSVFLQCKEALFQQLSVLCKCLAPWTTQDFHLFHCQLKRCLLKLQTFARGVAKEESKINVHDVAFNVNQNVTIVSILDLEDVAQQRVGSQTLAEVVSGMLELSLFGIMAKLLFEVVHDL